MTLRYRFVHGSTGALVDIAELTPASRHASGPYRCLSCGREMIPSLGLVREHHFKHRTEPQAGACGRETYLHALAKEVVRDAFRSAVGAKRAYPLILLQPAVCRRHEKLLGIACEGRTVPRITDLTRWFTDAETERCVNGFRADVLLSSKDRPDVLLVEVAVSHRCDPAKLASGLRILEIGIESEDDALALRNGLDAGRAGTTAHNFRPLPVVTAPPCSSCDRGGRGFFVGRSGKAWFIDGSLDEIASAKARGGILHFALSEIPEVWERPIETLDHLVSQAFYEAHVAVRSCLLCQSHILTEDVSLDRPPIHCRKLRRRVPHTAAADCVSFVPHFTASNVAGQRAREAQWVRTSATRLRRPDPPDDLLEDGPDWLKPPPRF
ncbi:hypothetical protein LAZ40_04485 [Cereibacter sphaeroides]|uniref:hypothetical protein n=1 Tax=Cereibacter sphaeroides TaxID=1063 RepID=UPI001F1622BB|nr:hypothetical protein [Cereibacter sphaeroides]MCE6958313.1 hypothetical protein [Cereibacter sphaeroides]MCE6971923.1 hypothetical protein [Cereibacter sphaeroides]